MRKYVDQEDTGQKTGEVVFPVHGSQSRGHLGRQCIRGADGQSAGPIHGELMASLICKVKGESLSNVAKYVLIASLLLYSGNAFAQSADKDPAAIIELGAAASRSLTGGGASFGPNVAVEVTPIENWLEIEAGVTPLFTRHSTEWDTDVLFKKPWSLSKKAEFMVGVGPEWIHTREYGTTTDSPGVEVAGDFMFWPSAKHRFGLYVEPGYDYSFGRGHEQSLGISGGLLIGIGTRRTKTKGADAP